MRDKPGGFGRFSLADVELLNKEVLHRGFVGLERHSARHRLFAGGWGEAEREIVLQKQSATVLPYDPWQDRVVLIEQFRLPALAAGFPPVMTEIVAGLGEPGESPEATARRELREEAGLACGRLERIMETLLMQGGSDESITIYAAEVAAPGDDGTFGLAAEEEDIRVKVMPATEAIAAAAATGNATATLALLWLGANRERLRRAWA